MKKLFSIIIIAMLTLSLAACGSSESTSEQAAPKEGDKVELKIFNGQPRFKEQFENYFDQFAAKYKEEKGIDVEIKLELPAPEQASQILKTRLASNDSPDIFAVHAVNEIPMFAKAGYLEDLSDQPLVDNLLDTPREAVTLDGKVLAVPLETLSWGYLYNKEIFAELGLEIPETLSEMEQVVKTLEENDIVPFIASYKEASIPQLFLPLITGALLQTDNPDFMEKMNNDEGSFAELKGFFDVIDLTNAHSTERGFEVDGDQGSVDFANGEAAMWVQGPWYAESILKANESFDFGVAPLPINDNPEATLINSSTTTSLAVSSESKNKQVALDLINYIVDEQDSSQFFQDLKFNQVAKSHDYDPFPWLIEATEFIKAGKGYQDPSIPQAVKSESEKSFQSYLNGSMSQDDVIKALDRAWKESNKINN